MVSSKLIAKPGVKLYFPSQLGGDHYIDDFSNRRNR
jgi:hypothetical protein